MICSSMFIGPVLGAWFNARVGSGRVVDPPSTDSSTISSQIVRISFDSFIEGPMSPTPAASWCALGEGKGLSKHCVLSQSPDGH